jgi:hypothetical protein
VFVPPPPVHLDCGARPAEIALAPGSRVLLRRGGVCRGTLVLTGGGTRRHPAVVGAYGRGPRPRVVAGGEQAVLLRDASHVVVRDLELTNPGKQGPLRGIHVVARTRVVRDVTLRRLWIHDIAGNLAKGRHGSGGIQVETQGPPPVRFQRLRIVGNRVVRVSRSGISLVGTLDASRPDADTPWPEASTGVRIARNRIDRVAGDGIVPRGTVRAVVRGNVVSRGNLAGSPLFGTTPLCNAGIWTFHANRTLIERNEVFAMEAHDCDGTGFDIDYDQDGTVIQGNYSHGNEGGFVLLCSDDTGRHRADVRFNLSLDDTATLNTVPCPVTEGHVGDLSGIRVLHNTVVAAQPRVVAEQFQLPLLVGGGSFAFVDNVVVATQPQSAAFPCGESCSHNLFAGMPASGASPVAGAPVFADPARRGRGRAVGRGFRLRAGSPGIGAGMDVDRGGARDYFGDPVSRTVGFATGQPRSIGTAFRNLSSAVRRNRNLSSAVRACGRLRPRRGCEAALR